MVDFRSLLANNSNALLQAGTGLLSGQTPQQQVAMGAQGFMQGRQRNQTMDWLAKNYPDLAQGVQMGAISPADAFKTAWETKTKTTPVKFQSLPDGTYGTFNESTGEFKPLGTATKTQQPTSTMQELQAAGLQPGTEAYQKALLEHNKPKGMSVESDGAGGFRLVMGDVSGAKPLNVDQAKNSGFLLRATESEKNLEKLETQGTSLYNKTMGSLPGGVGNYGLSANAQMYDQAKRDFVNSILRRESGAVISPNEFDNAEKQYFPQPGDSPQVIEQKRVNRQKAIEGLKIGSGPGASQVQEQQQGVVPYTDYFGGN